MGGVAVAAVAGGAVGGFCIACWLIKRVLPKKLQQDEAYILSHRFYRVSGRGRVAYLIICLEEALHFYKQDLAAWEGILRKLWSITYRTEDDWVNAWLDSIGSILPSVVLTDSAAGKDPEEINSVQGLYEQAGKYMIVINALMESAYTLVCQWSPSTTAHDPNALFLIDEAKQVMKDFGVPFPSDSLIEPLLLQTDCLFGKPFNGWQFSRLSMER